MSIGQKRNFLCEKAKGDIIVFMDDDDYYPPCRVSHAVSNLKNYNIVGCSEIYIYYSNLNKIYKYGPFSKNHATCGTLAFTKSFFYKNKFNNNDYKSEEYNFLDKFKKEIKQLNSLKTILCISHASNTVDKNKFIQDKYLTKYKLKDIVNNNIDINFYKNIFNKKII